MHIISKKFAFLLISHDRKGKIPDIIRRSHAVGAAYCLRKPFDPVVLLELIDKARDTVPGIVIAGDFIVGFPGETEDDFAATIGLVEKAEYKNCFVFKYSPRLGTHSEKKLEDNVPASWQDHLQRDHSHYHQCFLVFFQ